MKTNETLEGNKLIAEFMITQKPSDDFCVNWKDKIGFSVFMNGKSKTYLYSKLKFHSSWDWLMPVVEKIDNFGVNVIVGRMFCDIKYIDPLNPSKEFEIRIASGVKMNAVYGAVIEFIKWYNENK